MSTGAVVNPVGVGGGAAGTATTPIGQGTRPLTSDAVFRIEVSLSSRKSSAIVMKTTARLYSLEGATPAVPGASPGKDAEWKSVAYGAPCIQLMRESTKHNCPFHIKIVIAEVESGISLLELEVDRSSQYSAMQTNFHTFSVGGKTYAVQFANDNEAERMLESIIDLFEQKEKAETVSFEKKPEEPIFKKPRSIRKLNKKDISTPCNFKHVSGITLQRTQTCEEELRGTIQRKMRSMSLSSLSRRKVRQEGGRTAAPNGVGVTNGNVSLERGQLEFRGLDVSPMIARKAAAKDSPKVGRSNSILNKFGSLRLTKKKPYSQVGPKGENGQSSSTTTDGQFVRDKNRMSLPSHYKQQSRPPLTGDLFDRRLLNDQNGQPVKALSRSSDDLTDPRATSNPNPSISRDLVSSPTRKAATLDRRHTFVAPTSPLRKGSPGPSQFNYTPYSRSTAAAAANQNQAQQQQQQFQRQQQLNGGVPYNYGRSATLGTHSAQYFQQQMRPYAAASMQAQSGGNLANVSGKLHMSDMGLQRTGLTSQTGYQGSGGGGGYGPPSGSIAAVRAGQGKRRFSMNEMHLLSMDGVGGGSGNIIMQMPPQATSAASNRPQRMSFDGGIPAHQQAQYFQQQKSPVMTNGPYQPYPQQPGPPSQGGAGQIHQKGMPLPPGQEPVGPINVSGPLPPQPNFSIAVTPTSANGYYPPTATAGQIQGYPPPPPGIVSTPRVMSAPQSNPGVISAPQQQQQQYPMQGGVSGASAPNSSVAPNVNATTSPTRSTGTRKNGDPLPYATVQVSETSPPHHHNHQAGQTSQTGGTRTSPGRGGTGKGGAAVLSKLPTSPSRQASVTHSSTGNRPREVITVSSPSAVSGRSPYDQLPTQRSRNSGMLQQQPMVGGAYPSYQPQGNVPCASLMAAPPPTKFTNLQLHQQYHQQYMRLHKQGSKTTPTSGRPTIQQYQEYQQKQQRERPPVAPKKSPPKQHQSSRSQPHPHAGHGQSLQYSPHHQHNRTNHAPPHTHQGPQLGDMPILHRQQYQPNNAASSANSSPSRPLNVQVNDTCANGRIELVPKSNTDGGARPHHDQQQISSPQGKQFAPQSTQAYDTLPAESDSLTNLDGSLVSVTDELDRFTEEMSKALEQFDNLLQPQTSKPLKQSAL